MEPGDGSRVGRGGVAVLVEGGERPVVGEGGQVEGRRDGDNDVKARQTVEPDGRG